MQLVNRVKNCKKKMFHVSERHAMFALSLLLREPLEFGLDLPIGQLWSDFDDFNSIGKVLKK